MFTISLLADNHLRAHRSVLCSFQCSVTTFQKQKMLHRLKFFRATNNLRSYISVAFFVLLNCFSCETCIWLELVVNQYTNQSLPWHLGLFVWNGSVPLSRCDSSVWQPSGKPSILFYDSGHCSDWFSGYCLGFITHYIVHHYFMTKHQSVAVSNSEQLTCSRFLVSNCLWGCSGPYSQQVGAGASSMCIGWCINASWSK